MSQGPVPPKRKRPPGLVRSKTVRRFLGLKPYVPPAEPSAAPAPQARVAPPPPPAAPPAPAPAPVAAAPVTPPEPPVAETPAPAPARPRPTGPVDLIISPNEISFAHGTGVLLTRLLEGRGEILAMRSQTSYDGAQSIEAVETLCLPHGMTERHAIFAQVVEWLEGYTVRAILCAPYFETDLTLAIAARAVTGAPLGLWIMDDNCFVNTGIRREVMAEAIEAAEARFAISPQLKRRYQSEFHAAFAVVPPLVTPGLVRNEPSAAPAEQRLSIIGNVWSPRILDTLSRTIAASGLKVTWFAPNADLWSQHISTATLAKRGIEVVPERDAQSVNAAVLASTAVIVPSDPGGTEGHEAALGAMSLPTRMPFILASAGTPMIVLGRPGTAAATFVEQLDVGRSVPYDGAALKACVEAIAAPAEQARIRTTAAGLAPRFSFEGAADFIFRTIAGGGRWPDERFESLLPLTNDSFGFFVDKPVPKHFRPLFTEVINLCDRLAAAGLTPDWVLDIGASTAIWSNAVSEVFTEARFVLCDPMFSRYPQIWSKPGFELVESAMGDKPGKATFSVSSDLYGSSLISVSDVVEIEDKVDVEILTVDTLAADKGLKGRGLLKADVQFAEHLVVEGARRTIAEQVDIVILELTLARTHEDARTLLEMCETMRDMGFRVFDQVGNWRLPGSGEMEQLDLVFVREDLDGVIPSLPAAS